MIVNNFLSLFDWLRVNIWNGKRGLPWHDLGVPTDSYQTDARGPQQSSSALSIFHMTYSCRHILIKCHEMLPGLHAHSVLEGLDCSSKHSGSFQAGTWGVLVMEVTWLVVISLAWAILISSVIWIQACFHVSTGCEGCFHSAALFSTRKPSPQDQVLYFFRFKETLWILFLCVAQSGSSSSTAKIKPALDMPIAMPHLKWRYACCLGPSLLISGSACIYWSLLRSVQGHGSSQPLRHKGCCLHWTTISLRFKAQTSLEFASILVFFFCLVQSFRWLRE